MKKSKIVWFADVPGWAYDNRATAISAILTGYDHKIIMNPVKNYSDAVLAIAHADLIVCPDPRLMKYLPIGSMTILHVNAIKIFVP